MGIANHKKVPEVPKAGALGRGNPDTFFSAVILFFLKRTEISGCFFCV